MAVTRKTLPARGTAAPVKSTAGPASAETATSGSSASSGSSSFASLFDKSTPATGGIDIPPGDYEAVLVYARLEQPNDKGTAVQFKYSVADEGDHQGKIIPSYYGVMGSDGSPGKGLGYFKRDLGKLGFADCKGEDIEDALAQLETAKDGVSIKVKLKDGYTNVYLDGIVEGSDIIDAWKAEMPDLPF